MTQLVVASLEVSPSSAKFILFSLDRGVIAEATSRYAPQVAYGPTQDPHGILECALGALRREEAFYTAPLRASFAEQVGLPSGLPVIVGCSDGAMNQLAIGALHTGVMSMSVGTSRALIG